MPSEHVWDLLVGLAAVVLFTLAAVSVRALGAPLPAAGFAGLTVLLIAASIAVETLVRRGRP